MKRSNAGEYMAGVIIGLVLAWIFCWPIVAAYNEAATYRKLTGKHVTTWEALWVDLRVQESVK